MTVSAQQSPISHPMTASRRARHGLGTLSVAILAIMLAGCAVLLVLPITLPIGPMYWDLAIYLDGAHRVAGGQIPSVDFFAPVGPLGYWLFAGGQILFPNAQPLLLAQWMLLAVTLPPLVPVLLGVERGKSRGTALALLFPFLAFQLLPMNVEQYSTFPSVDGYGIYNRHVTEILYVLMTALIFEKRQRVLLFVIAWTCLALFLTKITGFIAGGLLCGFAFAAGRVGLRTALGSLAVFAAGLALLQISLSFPSAYLADIAKLVTMNEEGLLPRFVQAASIHFGIFASGCILVAVLALVDRRALMAAASSAAKRPLCGAVWNRLFDRHALWLGVALLVGLFFESQNTGGQAFIFLWPVLLTVVGACAPLTGAATLTILALVAATAMPPLVNVLHRSARAVVGQLKYEAVPVANLGVLGQVTQRNEVIERAGRMLENYVRFPDAYEALADQGQLPTFTLYADLDFQVAWLMTVDEAVESIRAYEAANGVRFASVMSLNFANPFPYLLDRDAPRRIAIGADPSRAVPAPDTATITAVAAADLVLYPTCPVTGANRDLLKLYERGLAGHTMVRLSRCWIGYVRNGLRDPT